jgi:type IV pilus assembly protein PilA
MPEATLSMTASALRPQLQASLLQKLNATSAGKKNPLQKGFTLVELMIVIVIVGILSAVALPNFLNQTKKARLTEARTLISAGLKNAQQEYLEGAAVGSLTCADIAVPAAQNNWTYTCTPAATNMTISAAGSGPVANVNSGNWIITYATGVVTEGAPTGL